MQDSIVKCYKGALRYCIALGLRGEGDKLRFKETDLDQDQALTRREQSESSSLRDLPLYKEELVGRHAAYGQM